MSIFSKMASGYKRLLDEGRKYEWETAEITEYGVFNIPEEVKKVTKKKVEDFEASLSKDNPNITRKKTFSFTSEPLSGIQADGYYENGMNVYPFED